MFDAVEDAQVAFAQLELELPGRAAQAEAVFVLHDGIIFAERGPHCRDEPGAFAGAQRFQLSNRVGAKLDGSPRHQDQCSSHCDYPQPLQVSGKTIFARGFQYSGLCPSLKKEMKWNDSEMGRG